MTAGPAAALANPLVDTLAGGGSERAGVAVSAVTLGGRGAVVTTDGQTGAASLYEPGPTGLSLVSILGAAATATPTATTADAATATAPTAAAAVAPTAAAVGAKVVAFAAANLGTTVTAPDATGCAALVSAALTAAGAKSQEMLGTQGPIADHYVWGTLVYQHSLVSGYSNTGSLAGLEPGDVIQFDQYAEKRPDGSWSSDAHHTAIVESVNPTTGQINVLEQNANGNPAVTRGNFNPSYMTGGVISVYRPIPA
jgi:hypothetical protein